MKRSPGRCHNNISSGSTRHLGFLVFSFVVLAARFSVGRCDGGGEHFSSQNHNRQKKNNVDRKREPNKVISLAESINRSQKSWQDPERIEQSRRQWKQALQEIKEMAPVTQGKSEEPFLSRWKMFLDEPGKLELVSKLSSENNTISTTDVVATPAPKPDDKTLLRPRFEGFPSWERTLQDWADDVQEYMEKIEEETKNADYPMSTHGRPSKNYKKDRENKDPEPKPDAIAEDEIINETSDKVESSSTGEITSMSDVQKKQISLPIPAPLEDGDSAVPETDISDKSKRIWIVTTASLPWMTGTAVNPLLRAAYMTAGRKEAGGSVTLMLPWLERGRDQQSVYGDPKRFSSPEDQEEYVRTWLRETANLKEASEELNIKWYTAWQNKVENSLYSMGDITASIPAEDVDIIILEEPEHLNWYRAPGDSWTGKFKHVVGIVHTNYFVYAQEQPAALIRAPAMRLLCSWMCRAHCHRLIKLSGTLGQFAPEKELVENVHGVRAGFLDTGIELRKRLQSSSVESDEVFGPTAEPAVYFIGKMLWSKGLGSLMELLKYAEETAGISLKVDMYGGGPDKDAAAAKSKSLGLDMPFHGPVDHAQLALTHKVFINPSTSEVLCTTVAEALAMGKFVIVPSHPSNDFFEQFPNCLTYSNKEEFVGNLYYTLTHSPEPLSEEYSHALSWEAATERLEAAGCIPQKEALEMAEALSSKQAGIEIALPPLIDNKKEREQLANSFKQSRSRYRLYRERLAMEIEQNKVLPTALKRRMMNELEKRLDLDLDEILESPKLRLALSPAELDKQLLELYNRVTDGPGGDILRIVGGGQEVALQSLYLRRQAFKQRAKNPRYDPLFAFTGLDGDDDDDDFDMDQKTVSDWVSRALRRNLQRRPTSTTPSQNGDASHNGKESSEKTESSSMKMSISFSGAKKNLARSGVRVSSASSSFCPKRSPASSFSILI